MNMPSHGFPQQPAGFPPQTRTPAPPPQPQPLGDQKKSKKTRAKKDKQQKVSGRTNMRRVGIIGAAMSVLFILALLAMLGGEVSNDTFVLRATQNIGAQQVVSETMLEAAKIDADTAEPGSITADSPDELFDIARGVSPVTDSDGVIDESFAVVGRRAAAQVFAGQQIRVEMFSRLIEPVSQMKLEPTERAMSIEVPAERAAGGVLRAGDLVDVVAVLPEGNTHLVAQGIEIIGIQTAPSALQSASQRQASDDGRDVAATDLLPADPIPGVYVLRIDAELTATFADAQVNGEIHLMYRTPDSTDADPIDVMAADAQKVCASIERTKAALVESVTYNTDEMRRMALEERYAIEDIWECEQLTLAALDTPAVDSTSDQPDTDG